MAMSYQMNKQVIGLAAGVAGVLVVVGVGAYFDLVFAKVPEQPVATKNYPTSVISSELTKPINVYDRTKGLHPVRQSEPDSLKYNPSDLGKSDITKSE